MHHPPELSSSNDIQPMTEHYRILDFIAWGSAVFAAVSLANAAIAVSLVAGIISIALGLFRLYDRIRYGPVARS